MTDTFPPDFTRSRYDQRLSEPGEIHLLRPPNEVTRAATDPVSTTALVSYWQSVRPTHDLPHRSAIDPRRIQSLLPYTFILERIAPGLARFRVAGTGLSELMGMDVRGMPLSCLFAPGSRRTLSSQLEAVFAGPHILHAELHGPMQVHRPDITAEMVVLPLQGHDATASRAIGCIIAQGETGLPPRRFHIKHIQTRPVFSTQQGAEDTSLAKAAAPKHRANGAHLRLVVSN